MRQRVGLAQATLSPHRLVVLDEPAQGLDPIWRIRLRDRISDLRAAGATVLLASHDTAEVERLADTVVVLNEGRLVDTLRRTDALPPAAWQLRLAAPSVHVEEVFPTASPITEAVWRVEASDEVELGARLAALLAHGAHVIALEPEGIALEERVRKAIDRDG
jgi:ABC-type multidrug transport system ATPase subunit